MDPVAALAVSGPGNFRGLCLIRQLHLPLSVEQAAGKDDQEAEVIQGIYGNLQRDTEGLSGLGGSQIVGAAQQRHRKQGCRRDMPYGKPAPQQPGPVGHIQQHEAVEKAEPVGNHIGKVEPMPDIVQLPDDEAQHEKQQQKYTAQLVPQLHFLCNQEQEGQLNGEYAAVDVGQALFEVGFQSTAHIAGHLPHGIQQSLPGIFRGDVQPEAFGKGVDTGLGGLKCRQSRYLQNGGHADGKQGKRRHTHQIQPRPPPAGEPADLVAEEDQSHKNADKKAYIIVGVDREEQRYGIQEEPLFPQQRDFSQNHQGQQSEGIQPHDVPLETHGPGAQGVKGAEGHQRKILFTVELLQEQGEEHAREPQLDGHQKREIAQQPFFGDKYAQQVQRACQIIGDQAKVVHAHADGPAVEQTLPLPQAAAEGYEEGIILMVHIRIQHGCLAEGNIAADEHDHQHPHTGEGKGQRRKIPFPFPRRRIRQFHRWTSRFFIDNALFYHIFPGR